VVDNLTYDDMLTDIQAVLEDLTPKQAEVQTASGDWYKMRIIPYRTMDNRIDGAVLTFGTINEQKQAQTVLSNAQIETQQACHLVRDVFDMNEDPMAVLDAQGKLIIFNTAFSEVMKIEESQTQGMDVFAIHNGLLGETDLKAKLNTATESKHNFEVDADRVIRSDNANQYRIKGRVLQTGEDSPYRILLHFLKTS
jgi:two-component system CheB/CheR fusion protein